MNVKDFIISNLTSNNSVEKLKCELKMNDSTGKLKKFGSYNLLNRKGCKNSNNIFRLI